MRIKSFIVYITTVIKVYYLCDKRSSLWMQIVSASVTTRYIVLNFYVNIAPGSSRSRLHSRPDRLFLIFPMIKYFFLRLIVLRRAVNDKEMDAQKRYRKIEFSFNEIHRRRNLDWSRD